MDKDIIAKHKYYAMASGMVNFCFDYESFEDLLKDLQKRFKEFENLEEIEVWEEICNYKETIDRNNLKNVIKREKYDPR